MLKTQSHTFNLNKIGIFCQKWDIAELVLYGSALFDDLEDDDTIQLLVTFEENILTDLFDLLRMVDELEKICGCKVKLLSRKFVENNAEFTLYEKDLVFQEILYTGSKSPV